MTTADPGQERPLRLLGTARAAAARMALEARPLETGGILLGWREDETIVVSHVLQIGDPHASTHEYTRSDHDAQRALDAFRSISPDARIGYVGEWHSHPVDQPPSHIDYDSLRQLARETEHEVALAVFAVNHDDSVTPFLATATRDGREVVVHRRFDPPRHDPETALRGKDAVMSGMGAARRNPAETKERMVRMEPESTHN